MPIPVIFITVVIKRQAIAEKYPGGLDAFRAAKGELSEDSHLLGLAFMSSGEADSLLLELACLGIKGGTDCVIANIYTGPMTLCDDIEFYALTPSAAFDREWRAVKRAETKSVREI